MVIPLLAFLFLAADSPSLEERLTQHRNLGKAFYENPTTGAEAVAEFKAALDLSPNSNREKLNYGLALLRAGKMPEGIALLKQVQQRDPKLPHTWFNLGIYYKKTGDTRNAIAQFERMAQLVPNEPIAHYQLGALYKTENRMEDARREFERAAQLNPQLAAAQFQLYNLYRQTGHSAEAARDLEAFQRLKKQAEGAAIPEDVDWCVYAEIYDPPVSVTPTPAAPVTYEDHILESPGGAKAEGLALIDSTGSGDADLLVWSAKGVSLYRKGVEHSAEAGLSGVHGVIHVATGDFDNDGLTDLCILTESGPLLYKNVKGRFTPFAASLPRRRFERAVWIDYDHDYDLDLVLLGDTPALLRNQGTAGFTDRTADFPFVAVHPADAVKLRVVPDSKAFDLAVFYRDHAPVLYRDQLGGHYAASPYEGKSPDATIAADFDNDGRMDRARILPDGRVQVSLNRTQPARRWIRVRLEGIKSLKLAEDAEVEIKAGALYRKQTYAGVPLLFDTGDYSAVDVVRITWPNGLIQNEIKQATNHAYIYKEAQRLSGSCPMIWTWNGAQSSSSPTFWASPRSAQATAKALTFPSITMNTSPFPEPRLSLAQRRLRHPHHRRAERSLVSRPGPAYRRRPSRRHRDLHQREIQRPPVSRLPALRRREPYLSNCRTRRSGQGRTIVACSPGNSSIPINFRAPNSASPGRTRSNLISARPRHRSSRPASERLGGLAGRQHLPRRCAGAEGRTGDALSSNAGSKRRVEDSKRRYGHARRQTENHCRRSPFHFLQPQASHRNRSVRLLGRNLPERRRISSQVRRQESRCPRRGGSSLPRILRNPDSPGAQTARYVSLQFRFADIVLESDAWPVHSLRRRARTVAQLSTIAWSSWAPATSCGCISTAIAASAARRLDPRFPAQSRWLGQRPRSQYGFLGLR